ncbi:Rha family transcriptional regulator [Pseudogulbenkiania sp. MAI-1]|nr:Rha family transcriptional regulator [Pseudogulbenkiania sp. MAI-1]
MLELFWDVRRKTLDSKQITRDGFMLLAMGFTGK